MGRIWLAAALLLLVKPGVADDKSAATARLQSLEALTSLEGAAVKPWHLKLSVQLYDDKGKPSEQGDIEEWWAGPQQSLTTYSFPSYSGKLLKTTEGTFRTAHLGEPPLVVALLLDQIVHPMPKLSDIESSEPLIRKQTVGTLPLDCIMLAQPMKDIPVEPLGMFPTYCLDAEKDILRGTYVFGSVAAVQTSLGTFQKLTVATNVAVNMGPLKLGEAHITTLAGIRPDPNQFLKSDGLEPVGKIITVPGQFMDDQALVKIPPVYPPEEKSKHIDGVIILHAVIGRDGHVHSLQIKSGDNANLALSAMNAVRMWIYKPYLLNGQPVDVDTTIKVNFQYRGK